MLFFGIGCSYGICNLSCLFIIKLIKFIFFGVSYEYWIKYLNYLLNRIFIWLKV